MVFICLQTGRISREREGDGWLPAAEAEPYFHQTVGSDVEPSGRTDDGRFDTTHLSPEHAWRIGRDFLAHAIRYGYPMKVIREHFGPGARILEMGCGKELPMLRTLLMDHGAAAHHKPKRYVGVDLNRIKYDPKVSGVETTLLHETNIVTQPERLPDEVFDIVVSFEVIEHMDKADGFAFLDACVAAARRKCDREAQPGMMLISTPVNNGVIAKNHVYEWHRGELRRAFERRGCRVMAEYGTFANLAQLLPALTAAETVAWNGLADYHSPHVLSAVFAARHPEVARNVCWKVEVPVGVARG